jgi:hypothetical protein
MPARRRAFSSNENPNGPTRCRRAPTAKQSLATLPVFGGISGSTRTTFNDGFIGQTELLTTTERSEIERQRCPIGVSEAIQRTQRTQMHIKDEEILKERLFMKTHGL